MLYSKLIAGLIAEVEQQLAIDPVGLKRLHEIRELAASNLHQPPEHIALIPVLRCRRRVLWKRRVL